MTDLSIFPLLLAYRYWILIPLALFEGPVTSLAAGWFISLGYLNPFVTYIILIFGDVIPDMLYFWIGHLTNQTNFLKRYGPRVGITEDRLRSIERFWHMHTFKVALLSKWAYGISTPILISAGLTRLPLKKFVPPVFSISVIQYAILLTIGYYFGSSYQTISTYIQNAEWVVAGIVILFILIYFFVSRYAKQSLLKNT